MRPPPTEFDGSFELFFEQHIVLNLPSVPAVVALHEDLRSYVAEADPIFFLRQVTGSEPWRRRSNRHGPTRAVGGRVAFTDNSPQVALHALAYRNAVPHGAAFSQWLQTRMPCHIFELTDAIGGESLNTARWHAAHIFDVKDGQTDWMRWSRAEFSRRFRRNVHPCNLLPLPMNEWQRLGKQENLRMFAVQRYRERYGGIVEEAMQWIGAQAEKSETIPTIRYSPASKPPSVGSDGGSSTLILKETSGRRVHLEGFGARFGGPDGKRAFSLLVQLGDGSIFGPISGLRWEDLLTKLDLQGDHYRRNEYFSCDFFSVEGGQLRGRTQVARRLAERLNEASRIRS